MTILHLPPSLDDFIPYQMLCSPGIDFSSAPFLNCFPLHLLGSCIQYYTKNHDAHIRGMLITHDNRQIVHNILPILP